MEGDRLFIAIGLVKDRLKPEFAAFLNAMEDLSAGVNYMDYADWCEYYEQGLKEEVLECMDEFLKED